MKTLVKILTQNLIHQIDLQGILLLNKAKGDTSFSYIPKLRRLSGIKKIGHAGTLDPLAEGLLIFLIGKRFTTKADAFLHLDKDYVATIYLGEGTDTYDQEGKILKRSEKIPKIQEIMKTLSQFQGKISQIPPMFSAKKVGGKKLYELARKDITIERKPINVEVDIALLNYTYPYLSIQVTCSKGTYIRSLAEDIGNALGTYGHLSSLERTRIGPFHLKNALSAAALLQDIQENNPSHLKDFLLKEALLPAFAEIVKNTSSD